MKRRKYKTGTRWCVWRWTETPSGYITRLHLVQTPWFAICLHWLNGPDPEPWLHDHPVSFLSLILRGCYTERRAYGPQYGVDSIFAVTKVNRWFNWIRATPNDRHTIVEVKPGTVTLCFMGPKRRAWGFHTDKGWVHWKHYNDEKYASLLAANARDEKSRGAL